MDAERWRQIDELFRAVSQAEPERRGALLAELSGDDRGLRREVEGLLEASEEAGGFLETNVFEAAAPLLAGESHELKPGQFFGRYHIIKQIGAGGMGEVYLAEDTHLKRKVALKLLPDLLTADPERVRRFEREAQAVTSLSHPHIVTIHEVFQAEGGLHCIVMEHVEGRTLRELMAGGTLKLFEALDVAVQAASALAAAHEAGVVHRDVKPENVMVRRDGYVKVLDFGLAKLTERSGAGGEQAALIGPLTQSGMVMGTAHYMSPEQARALKVDARTDVWSLGVVLYEMLAGRPPFDGETMSDVLVSILSKELVPLSESAPHVPEEARRVVSKALSKEKEGRYASMREMLEDLREARDEATFRTRQELHLSGDGGTVRDSLSGAGQGRAGRPWSRAALWGAVLLVALSALGFGAYAYLTSRRAPHTPAVKMNRVTANGKIWGVAISRDGRHITYTAGPKREQSLWVMQTGTGSNVQIVPPAAELMYWGLTFSPDGDYVYFVRNVGSGPWELYRVPTLGGTPKKLLAIIDTAVEFSPDGARMVFGRQVNAGENQLVVANTDGTGERVIATRKAPALFGFKGLTKIAWSPDGGSLACPANNADYPDDLKYEVVEVSLKDGAERLLTRERWHFIKQVAWLGDGSGLVVVGRNRSQETYHVWHLSYPEGSMRRLSNDFSEYDDVSVTADSSTVVTVQSEQLSNIWIAPGGDASRARQITDSRNDGYTGISWTPDGRVVFTSKVGGNTDIWITDSDGGNRRRLTDYVGSDEYPSVSPDGRYVVFESRRAGGVNVWRMEIDGGNPVQLTDGNDVYGPQCSADGRWVYYSAAGAGYNQHLWRVPIDGGEPVQLSAEPASRPVVSPDRKWLAYKYWDFQADLPYGVAVAPIAGGPPVRRLNIHHETGVYRWTPDGRGLAYVDDRNINVWAQPVDGGQPRQLTDFKNDQTFFFDWSRDGKQMALARGTQTSDVVLITDFK